MNLIAKMTEYGTTYRYYLNEYDEVVRTGDGQRVCYPSWSGDILSEDLPNMEITYMRKYVCDFYLDESNVEDWFEDYASVVEKIQEYKNRKGW